MVAVEQPVSFQYVPPQGERISPVSLPEPKAVARPVFHTVVDFTTPQTQLPQIGSSEARKKAWDTRGRIVSQVVPLLAAQKTVAEICAETGLKPTQVRNAREKARMRGLLPHPDPVETQKAKSEAHKGKPGYFAGRTHTPETIVRMTRTRRKRPLTSAEIAEVTQKVKERRIQKRREQRGGEVSDVAQRYEDYLRATAYTISLWMGGNAPAESLDVLQEAFENMIGAKKFSCPADPDQARKYLYVFIQSAAKDFYKKQHAPMRDSRKTVVFSAVDPRKEGSSHIDRIREIAVPDISDGVIDSIVYPDLASIAPIAALEVQGFTIEEIARARGIIEEEIEKLKEDERERVQRVIG